MTIGITGGRGILGRRFQETAAARGETVSVYSGDIRDLEALRAWIAQDRPDRIVHCAARVAVPTAEADPQDAFAINVGGTLAILKALEETGRPIWFFYASSSHVYAESSGAIAETHPVGPRSVYALTKYLGEQTAAYYGRQPNLRVCIGRIFSLHDPEQTGTYLYPATAARLATHAPGTPLPIRDGNAVRDFSSAAALAEAIHRLMERQAEGIFNIGSGIGRSVVAQLALWFGPGTPFTAEGPPSGSSIVADTGKLQRLVP